MRTDSFFVSTAEHKAGLSIPKHAHGYGAMHFVLSGVYNETIEGKQFEAYQGQLLYKPPEVSHTNNFRMGGSQCYRVELPCHLFDRMPLPNRPVVASVPRLSGLFNRIGKELSFPDDLSSTSIECGIWDVLCETIRLDRVVDAGSDPCSVATEAMERLRADLQNPPSVENLANSLDMHRSQLSRAFKKHVGLTIPEFVRRQRVDRAVDLLKNTKLPISVVAHDCGFSDQSHLSRCFRQVLNMTPSKWRAQHTSLD